MTLYFLLPLLQKFEVKRWLGAVLSQPLLKGFFLQIVQLMSKLANCCKIGKYPTANSFMLAQLSQGYSATVATGGAQYINTTMQNYPFTQYFKMMPLSDAQLSIILVFGVVQFCANHVTLCIMYMQELTYIPPIRKNSTDNFILLCDFHGGPQRPQE